MTEDHIRKDLGERIIRVPVEDNQFWGLNCSTWVFKIVMKSRSKRLHQASHKLPMIEQEAVNQANRNTLLKNATISRKT